ncbi:MAG: hypothetical protein ACK5M8_09410, partial [Shewanella algae]
MENLLSDAGAEQQDSVMAFSFGNAERLLKDTWLTDMAGVRLNEEFGYYEPPLDRKLLYQVANGNAYQGPVLLARRNMILNAIQTKGKLTRNVLGPAIHNYLLFGDMALLKIRNRASGVVEAYPLSTHYLRRCPDGHFKYLEEDVYGHVTARPYRA